MDIVTKGKIYHIDDKAYRFNFDLFTSRFNEICRAGIKKKDFREELAKQIGLSDETIEGWRKKKNSPQTVEDIKRIANVFDMDYMRLLISEEKEEVVMNNVMNSDAKNAARMLYEEFCEMIDGLEMRGKAYDSYPYSEETAKESKWLAHYEPIGRQLEGHEGVRHDMKMAIRKTSVDLPLEFRKKLNMFVDRCIGPVDYDYPNYQYFNTDEFKAYLEKNNLKGTETNRVLYSLVYCMKLFDELDELFKDYICW